MRLEWLLRENDDRSAVTLTSAANPIASVGRRS
jgi:hypothetical protein